MNDQKKRIIFVDDETRVLDGLRRMLRPMRQEWDMSFANSAHEALDLMKLQPFDVIVTDIKMPGMDGVRLLNQVMYLHPRTIRFILSGHSDHETIYRTIGPTHQFLSKPCAADTIKERLTRAFALREMLADEKLKTLASKTRALPSLPKLYMRVTRELESHDPSVQKVGRLVEKDIGMSAKVLHLVNSAFFGVPEHIRSANQAVAMLGLQCMKSLVLVENVFSQFSDCTLSSDYMEALRKHSVRVGSITHYLCGEMHLSGHIVDEALLASFLHDAGKLVLATELGGEYARILDSCADRPELLAETEKKLIGATHGEVGAYLLGLWGMSDPVVEAVAFHHNPRNCTFGAISPLVVIHIANALDYQLNTENTDGLLDLDYIRKLGLEDRIPVWLEGITMRIKAQDKNEFADET